MRWPVGIAEKFSFTVRATVSCARKDEMRDRSCSSFDVLFEKSTSMTLSVEECPTCYMAEVNPEEDN